MAHKLFQNIKGNGRKLTPRIALVWRAPRKEQTWRPWSQARSGWSLQHWQSQWCAPYLQSHVESCGWCIPLSGRRVPLLQTCAEIIALVKSRAFSSLAAQSTETGTWKLSSSFYDPGVPLPSSRQSLQRSSGCSKFAWNIYERYFSPQDS